MCIRDSRNRGYEVVGFEEPADVYVINTCTVTGTADRKSRQMVRPVSYTHLDVYKRQVVEKGGPSMRGWAEISIQTAQEAVEAVANILHEAGAGGVVIEDPAQLVARADELGVSELLKAAPLNGNVTVKAYLPVNVKLEARIKALQRELNRVLKLLAVPGEISLQEVAEEEWATAWKTYYKPFRVGEHIVIKPAWEECGTAANEIVIELDPGLAFGTGNHPTTVMALTLLERYLQMCIRDSNVVDADYKVEDDKK